MSDLQEMAKELKRAIELRDRAAARMIAREMSREAEQLGLDDIGMHLLEAVQSGQLVSALAYTASLGRRAAEYDAQRGQFFGEGFQTGRAYVGEVHSLLRG